MSYDLHVYGARDSLGQKEDLVGLLSKKGWQVRFLSGRAFITDELRPVLSSTGPLEDWCLMAGWKKKSRYAEVLAAWVDRRELHHFQKMTAETACFGCCELSIGPLPNDEDENEDRVALGLSEQFAKSGRKADTDFYLRSSAGRSPISFEFQHTVWEAIGELTDGRMDNPQEGAVKSASASFLTRIKQWARR